MDRRYMERQRTLLTAAKALDALLGQVDPHDSGRLTLDDYRIRKLAGSCTGLQDFVIFDAWEHAASPRPGILGDPRPLPPLRRAASAAAVGWAAACDCVGGHRHPSVTRNEAGVV